MTINIQSYPKSVWIFIASFLIIFSLLLGFRNSVPSPTAESDIEYSKYYIRKSDGALITLYLENASTNDQRSQGLMYRDYLPKSHGMIFIFDHPQLVSFWMKNTYISLDIIMLDANGEIRQIHKNTVPESTKSIRANAQIKYVIEINGGEAKKHGLRIGDLLLIDE